MKRIATFPLLVLLVIQFTGLHCFFAITLSDIKEDMREQVQSADPETLTKITVTLQQYRELIRNYSNDEIRINDEMFDIQRVEQTGEVVTIYGLYDDLEHEVLALIHALFKGTHKRTKVPNYLAKVFGGAFLPSSFDMELAQFLNASADTAYDAHYDLISLRIDSPPPWCITAHHS